MEATQGKPRVKYSDFAEKKGTVAWFIDRRIAESKKPGARPLGVSHFYCLRRLKNAPIGKCLANKLTPQDLIDHCRMRKAGITHLGEPVKPQSIRQDVTYLRSTLRTYVDLDELDEKCLTVFRKSMRLLTKEQLIGEFPRKHYADFLEYCSMEDDEFQGIVDKWRPPHIWKHEGRWELRNPIWRT